MFSHELERQTPICKAVEIAPPRLFDTHKKRYRWRGEKMMAFQGLKPKLRLLLLKMSTEIHHEEFSAVRMRGEHEQEEKDQQKRMGQQHAKPIDFSENEYRQQWARH